MSTQPPSRTKFYRDKRNGKVMGVCAGIADYTGFDVTLVRIMMVAALLMSSGGLGPALRHSTVLALALARIMRAAALLMSRGSILPLYFIAGWIADDKPSELAIEDRDEQRFWQGVRQSPARSARDIRSRIRDID